MSPVSISQSPETDSHFTETDSHLASHYSSVSSNTAYSPPPKRQKISPSHPYDHSRLEVASASLTNESFTSHPTQGIQAKSSKWPGRGRTNARGRSPAAESALPYSDIIANSPPEQFYPPSRNRSVSPSTARKGCVKLACGLLKPKITFSQKMWRNILWL